MSNSTIQLCCLSLALNFILIAYFIVRNKQRLETLQELESTQAPSVHQPTSIPPSPTTQPSPPAQLPPSTTQPPSLAQLPSSTTQVPSSTTQLLQNDKSVSELKNEVNTTRFECKPCLPCPDCKPEKSYNIVFYEKLLIGSTKASVVARYGERPWGNASGFVDQKASWIWAPGPTTHPKWIFFTTFQNSSSIDVDLMLHFICDQYGVAYIDGNTVAVCKERGWLQPDYSQVKVTVGPGDHLFAIYAENSVDSGGVIAALVAVEGSTIVTTNESWKCKKISLT